MPATPTNREIITPGLFAGLGVWPQWRRNMVANTWAIVAAQNKISTLNPALSSTHNPDGGTAIWNGTGGQPNVIDAWSGAAFDDDTDTMIVWGGGHEDYAGNEPYDIRLDLASPIFRMIHPPAGAGLSGQTSAYLAATSPAPASLGTYLDGRPRSQHSYCKIVFAHGYMYLVRNNGGYPDGQHGDNLTWRMHVATGVWESVCVFGSITGIVIACVDTLRNRIWAFQPNTQQVRWLDLANPFAGWTTISSDTVTGAEPPAANWYACASYMAMHDLMIITSGRHTDTVASAVLIFDPLTNIYYQPTLLGPDITATLLNMGYSFPAFVPAQNACYLWDNIASRANLVKLQLGANPRTDAIVKSFVTPHASNSVTPPARANDGTYGRFRYSRRLNGFWLLNDVNEHINFYALS